MLDVAKNKTSLFDKEFIVGDILKTPLEKTFDSVVSVMMFDAINDNDLGSVLGKIQENLNPNGYLLLIEDKERKEYENIFKVVEKGVFEVSKDKKFNKWYFIGQKSN